MYTFNTEIGLCGIDWTEKGISSVVLGCRKRSSMPKPPAWVCAAAARITRHLEGKSDSLTDIKLDVSSCPDFHQKVYRALQKVKPGKVVTYGELAQKIGHANAARAVGTAMARNPVPLIVPCHRVVKSDGSLGNYSAPGGSRLKRRLLRSERAKHILTNS